jgi:hypothetical protein
MTPEEEKAYLALLELAEQAIQSMRKHVHARSDRSERLKAMFILNECLDSIATIEKRYDRKPS